MSVKVKLWIISCKMIRMSQSGLQLQTARRVNTTLMRKRMTRTTRTHWSWVEVLSHLNTLSSRALLNNNRINCQELEANQWGLISNSIRTCLLIEIWETLPLTQVSLASLMLLRYQEMIGYPAVLREVVEVKGLFYSSNNQLSWIRDNNSSMAELFQARIRLSLTQLLTKGEEASSLSLTSLNRVYRIAKRGTACKATLLARSLKLAEACRTLLL